MCFYVRIVLPPSSFLHFVTFVLNKLSFGPETVLFLKTTSSIYSLDDGILNHWLCAVFIPESKARGEAGGVGSKFLLNTCYVPGTKLFVRGLKMEPDTALAGHSGSQSSPRAHNIENIIAEGSTQPADTGGRSNNQFFWDVQGNFSGGGNSILNLLIQNEKEGVSWVIQRLRLHASTAGGMSLIPSWGTKILHASEQLSNFSVRKACAPQPRAHMLQLRLDAAQKKKKKKNHEKKDKAE